MKNRKQSKPLVKIAKVARNTGSKPTTQAVLEDLFRHECFAAGCTPQKTGAIIADFRKRFAGQYDHPANPTVIAMAEAEKQATTEFMQRLESMNRQNLD